MLVKTLRVKRIRRVENRIMLVIMLKTLNLISLVLDIGHIKQNGDDMARPTKRIKKKDNIKLHRKRRRK